MAKRGYKLQEFVAHAGNVNCLTFGKKNCRVFITGGDDQKLNLWSIGKPTCVTSLCGHTSPVESAAFDSTEVLVIGGSSSGAIKLWDLEETKMVRTLTGHRSYCTAVEFHPFGEFFASGSMDTNLKIWDIRKKGCIHTYKGHTRGISTIRFTPDGRWVVSGGFDNVVKVWDLTAGKLLHDFKFHEGHIRSIEFHPLEFLLATGSADKTVKFWDLETFEMIGSARREAAGVRSIAFHPDGRTLFCGLDNSLKVYSWEPVICHDSVDMGWSTLGDLCIHDGKLLGGAYYENSVAVWVADVSLIEPYGTRLAPGEYNQSEEKSDSEKIPLKKDESNIKSKPDLQFDAQDTDPKEIKTIYVDPAGVNSVSPKAAEPIDIPKVICSSDSKDISIVVTQKRGPAASLPAKANAPAVKNRSVVIPRIVPRDGPDGKEFVGSRRESIASAKASGGVPSKQSARRLSTSRIGMERMSLSLDSLPSETEKSRFGIKKDSDLRDRVIANENAKESSDGKLSNVPDRLVTNGNAKEYAEEKQSSIKTIADNLDIITSSSAMVSSEQSPDSNKGVASVKVINGVTVVQGRTRSLVERFEKKEKLLYTDEVQKPERGSSPTAEPLETPPNEKPVCGSGLITKPLESPQTEKPDSGSGVTSEPLESPPIQKPNRQSGMTVEPLEIPPIQKPGRGFGMTSEPLESLQTQKPSRGSGMTAEPLESPRIQQPGGRSHVTAEPLDIPSVPKPNRSHVTAEPLDIPSVPKPNRRSHVTSEPLESPSVPKSNRRLPVTVEPLESSLIPKPDRRFRTTSEYMETPPIPRSDRRSRVSAEPLESPPIPRPDRRSRVSAEPPETPPMQRLGRGFGLNAEPLETPSSQNCDQKIVMPEESSSDDNIAIENLMHSHDVLLSTFRSRLTKLQVVRHFWERNDLKGAINAVKRLPDHSVQADVASALIERLDRITLDLFSCLLPVLLRLLESKAERHVAISLEMLLKLVAVFGTTVHSTVSAPPGVGVDLHAEERRECCRQCLSYLHDIQNKLPELVKRGSSFARFAQQLNLVLQQT